MLDNFASEPKVAVKYAQGRVDSATLVVKDEDHTLGNALRYSCSQSPAVGFAGYTVPHPSEPFVHIRVQSSDGSDALERIGGGIDSLEGLCGSIKDKFNEALRIHEEGAGSMSD